ncbi:type 2 periplasmic-binding domain-containing protein [Marinobacter orientalis]|uniref:LysR substrate binding domain-containing protein n=1 Tax=Marinobacter orientalis TaxID=1928859 RepID=A0A7Y0WTM1_9GAMM|nr:hypothetical protein [Marinobacter orientalis]NMT65007.1 hypothetical protein [Marinobacter orientalis]TGX48102.1 hypothetical protein DIT72_15900 [Marinobacter orientalis]
MTSLLYFKRMGQLPKIAAHTNTIENMRALIGKVLGYGLTHFRPQVDLTFTGDRLVTLPVTGVSPGIDIIAGYANRNESWLPDKTRAFLEETRAYFASGTARKYFVPHPS